ncbi:MAG: hypothetical protein RI883_1032 [Bacteroidota bacterium]|jgi:hypothetical protein
MLQKLNIGILITALTLFCYSLYSLILKGELYPYLFLLFYSFLCISAYFSLYGIRTHHTKTYILFSCINLINIVVLFADYFYLDLLKSTWNFSFALIFLQLLIGFLLRIKSFKGKIATITFWSTIVSTCLIEGMLFFKLSNELFHLIIIYSFLLSSILILVLFGLKLKRKHQ